MLSDPAAVSGHLAIDGVPTGACQPRRRCRPADKTLNEAQSLHFRYGSLVALPTLSPIRCLLRPKARFPVRRLHLLSGREFHPLEAPGLSWRTFLEIRISPPASTTLMSRRDRKNRRSEVGSVEEKIPVTDNSASAGSLTVNFRVL